MISMKRIVTGILAHVDAGKTTCIESMLYTSKTIRKLGRVDHQDAYLDYDNQERERGITIYSKEAHFHWKDSEIYLIDTPGHVDFSSEMERSLQVLDLAILLINGQDGIQSHTSTIWKCLKHYKIPTLIFINKMDISYKTQEELMNDLKTHFSSNCINFKSEDAEDELSMLNEDIMNHYLETEEIDSSLLQQAIFKRECFPVFFGSALKIQGIEDLMDAIIDLSFIQDYPEDFGARVYKISSDDQGNRLTHVKITGGVLNAKDKVGTDEKVDQIRLYNGKQFEMVQTAYPGMICALKGLNKYEVGQGLGFESDTTKPLLNAYMNYQLLLPEGVDALTMMRYCSVLAQEDPQLQIEYDEQRKQIFLRLMGSIQMEILQKEIEKRSKVKVGFTTGKVLFKETIQNTVIGVGHFEPLRHYAEVHLKLEPLPRGKGLVFESNCSNDDLALNWQNLILTHLKEKQHKGVLTGSPITDIKITLVAGKAHLKHTEGGDFRQATYRAIRQGLKEAESVLLEPYYSFELVVENQYVSKALFDLENKHCSFKIEEDMNNLVHIKGTGPVRELMDYQKDVIAYTKGKGQFICELEDYHACFDQEKIIEETNYDSEADLNNPTGSVFCEHGAGYFVPWDEVKEHMHIQIKEANSTSYTSYVKHTVREEELKKVFNSLGGNNKKAEKPIKKKAKVDMNLNQIHVEDKKPECLMIDGYNMIYDWQDLKDIAKVNIESARDELINRISNYQGYKQIKVILVFDGYRVKNNTGSHFNQGNLDIIYTRYNQTADSYIEKAVHDLKKKYELSVATSDGLIQNAILANGAKRISARELEIAVKNVNKRALSYLKK